MHPFPVAILLSVGIVPDSSVGPEYSEFKVELPEHFFGPSAAYAALIPSATARGGDSLGRAEKQLLNSRPASMRRSIPVRHSLLINARQSRTQDLVDRTLFRAHGAVDLPDNEGQREPQEVQLRLMSEWVGAPNARDAAIELWTCTTD